MKKTFALLLAFTLLFTLSACSKKVANTPGKVDTKKLEKLVADFDRSTTIEKVTLYNNSGIEITANQLSFSEQEVQLEVSIINGTDKQLSFYCGSVACCFNSINGIMLSDGYFCTDVSAGDSSTGVISFDIMQLIANGFSFVADIEIRFYISGDDFENCYTDVLKIKTSKANDFDYSKNAYQEIMATKEIENITGIIVKYFSGENLYESSDNTIKVKSVAVTETNDNETLILFEIENSSSVPIEVSGKEVYVNGELLKSTPALWFESVNPGKRVIASFSLTSLLNDYSGNKDMSKLSEFTFTLNATESGYIERDSGIIKVDITKSENIEITK
ncbi:MAG: hypothetical protein ACI4KI_04665 [Candidatus Fimenecus sp.]